MVGNSHALAAVLWTAGTAEQISQCAGAWPMWVLTTVSQEFEPLSNLATFIESKNTIRMAVRETHEHTQ